MVRAWLMDDSPSDQRLPHMTDPPQFVSVEELEKEIRVLYWKIDADRREEEGLVEKIKKERRYSYEDTITITRAMPEYEKLNSMFFQEHIHGDEEIRLILDGSGYIDCRNRNDQWIRIELEKGDLIVLPEGIYHRFTLDTNDYLKANRMFAGDPVWTAFYRPVEDHPSRLKYVASLA